MLVKQKKYFGLLILVLAMFDRNTKENVMREMSVMDMVKPRCQTVIHMREHTRTERETDMEFTG